ncbi:MAG: BadF/BadG/BcrA/BcrD ATPase family protein [Sneathiella sp.]|uniref:BadF/BadG/BcrA/BcrD ATPase family protein n=1 Tax=Sneathiella sp. TaxID=1964365 RepID=UPI003001A30C
MTQTTNHKPTYLAADCGGTHCRVRLYDLNGDKLSEGTAGPANASLGLDVMLSAVIDASKDALTQLTGPSTRLSSLKAGLAIAGLVNDDLRTDFCQMEHPFASLSAETDAFVARLGAFGTKDGALLITGTGSCGFGVVDAKSFYVGGWGFSISDQGSGARLGHLAVRRAVQAFDAIQPSSPLCKEILNALGGTAASAHHWAMSARPADYGKFAAIVFAHADQGDPVAEELLVQIATEIDELVCAMLNKGSMKICHMGGLSTAIRSRLAAESVRHLVEPEGDTCDGALQLIRENLGLINSHVQGK